MRQKLEIRSCTNSVNFGFRDWKLSDTQIRLHPLPFSLTCQGPLSTYGLFRSETKTRPATRLTSITPSWRERSIFIYELTLSPKAQAALATTYGTVPLRFVHALSGHGNFEAAVLPLFHQHVPS